jgi:hypothetical protein
VTVIIIVFTVISVVAAVVVISSAVVRFAVAVAIAAGSIDVVSHLDTRLAEGARRLSHVD